MAIVANVAPHSPLQNYLITLSLATVGILAAASLIVGCPFTMTYARQMTSPDKWNQPGFHRTNMTIVLTTYADHDSIFPALRAGACGYLTKDASPSPSLAGGDIDLPAGLTTREAEVLTLIADGLSNTEIADRLTLSAATVKTHINRIFSKTNVRDRAQAVRYAHRNGLATPKH